MIKKQYGLRHQVLNIGVVTLIATSLFACGGDKSKKASQSLASVNGEEITVMQLNEEMQRAGVTAAQQQEASKQLLASLVDRQLLLGEALRQKIDRDPKVMQQIERARAQIIAQSYMQTKLTGIGKPTTAEVEAYFNQHPEFFSRRQQFDMRQIMFAGKDMSDDLKQVIDESKSLDEVASWMSSKKIVFSRGQISRSSAELPQDLGAKLKSLSKGQLFIVKEGERTMLMSVVDVKESPVSLGTAAPQIEQFLFNSKSKELAKQEVERLRSTAKIEYFNQSASAASAKAATSNPASSSAGMTERGAAGLKE